MRSQFSFVHCTFLRTILEKKTLLQTQILFQKFAQGYLQELLLVFFYISPRTLLENPLKIIPVFCDNFFKCFYRNSSNNFIKNSTNPFKHWSGKFMQGFIQSNPKFVFRILRIDTFEISPRILFLDFLRKFFRDSIENIPVEFLENIPKILSEIYRFRT